MESCGDICIECCSAQKIQTESGVGHAAFGFDAGISGTYWKISDLSYVKLAIE